MAGVHPGFTGATAHRPFFRVNSTGTIPFGATRNIGLGWAVSAQSQTGASSATDRVINRWAARTGASVSLNPGSGTGYQTKQTRITRTHNRDVPNNTNYPPAFTGSILLFGGQSSDISFDANSSNTGIAIHYTNNGSTDPRDWIPVLQRGSYVSLSRAVGGAVAIYRVGTSSATAGEPAVWVPASISAFGYPSQTTGIGYYVIAVQHISGSWASTNAGSVTLTLPADYRYDSLGMGGAGNDVGRAYMSPDENNWLYIAHPMPLTGGTATIGDGTAGTQTQPINAGIKGNPATAGRIYPDSPSGGVGFWGLRTFPDGNVSGGVRRGEELINYEPAIQALAAAAARQQSGGNPSFASGTAAQAWINSYGFWTNYDGPGNGGYVFDWGGT